MKPKSYEPAAVISQRLWTITCMCSSSMSVTGLTGLDLRALWFRLAQKTGSSRLSSALDLSEKGQHGGDYHDISRLNDGRGSLRRYRGGTHQKVFWDVGETVFRVLKPRPMRPSMSLSDVKELDTVSAASTACAVTVTSPTELFLSVSNCSSIQISLVTFSGRYPDVPDQECNQTLRGWERGMEE